MATLERMPIPLVEVVAVLACTGVLAAVLGPLLIHRGFRSLKIHSAGVLQTLCALLGAVVGVFAGSELYRRSGGAGTVWLWYAAGGALGGLVGVLGARRRRPWLQFRLRALFAMTAAAAVVLALARNYNDPGRAEQHAMATVRGMGGWVTTRLIAPSWLHPEYRAVDSIHLNRTTDAPDDELQSIRGLSHLREVWIGSPDVSDRDLRFLRHQTNLRRLLLPRQVTDAALAHLVGVENLESLDLRGTQVTSSGLAYLEGLQHLKYLDLRFTSVDDAGLAHLKWLTKLEELDLQNTRVSGAGLAHLGALARLRVLNLRHTPVDDAGLAHLKGLGALEELELSETQVTGLGLAYLSELSQLRLVQLKRASVTDEGLAGAAGLNNLRWLALERTNITDAGLEHLKAVRGLLGVSLDDTGVTQQGVDALKQSLPRLNASGNYRLSVAQRAAMRALRELGFSMDSNGEVIGAGSDSTQINDCALAHLCELNTVRWLNLNDTQISDAGIEHLKGLTNLEYLDLSRTRISDAGLTKLADLAKLERLSLIGTGVTDAGLKHLRALPNLRWLWLNDTQVTDAGLEHLKGIETLEYLEVSPWRVTAAAAQGLEVAMPRLDVVR